MFETKIKPDYSEAIAKFVKSGGQLTIVPVVK